MLIRELLHLNHLNSEDLTIVSNLIRKYTDRFQIPGEPLEARNVAKRSIPTNDEQPLFTQFYFLSSMFITYYKLPLLILACNFSGKSLLVSISLAKSFFD